MSGHVLVASTRQSLPCAIPAAPTAPASHRTDGLPSSSSHMQLPSNSASQSHISPDWMYNSAAYAVSTDGPGRDVTCMLDALQQRQRDDEQNLADSMSQLYISPGDAWHQSLAGFCGHSSLDDDGRYSDGRSSASKQPLMAVSPFAMDSHRIGGGATPYASSASKLPTWLPATPLQTSHSAEDLTTPASGRRKSPRVSCLRTSRLMPPRLSAAESELSSASSTGGELMLSSSCSSIADWKRFYDY